MVTGELKSKIDGLWEIFWTGGLTNPLDVIEQMTYLMFIRDLDDADNLHAKEAAMLGLPHKSNPYYLCAYTNLPHGKRQIDEGTGGAAQQHFNVGKYNKLQLMLPPIEKQDEFVLFMEQVDKSKVVIQAALDKSQLLFDSLMQKYFG